MKARTIWPNEGWFLSLLFCAAMSLMLSSCSTAPLSVPKVIQTVDRLDSNSTVIVLPPYIRFENLRDESLMSDSPYGGDLIALSMVKAGMAIVKSRGFARQAYDGLQGDSLWDKCRQLQLMTPRLFSGQPGSKGLQMLRDFGPRYSHPMVLAQSMTAKVGSSGTWNPMSGAITSSNSSAQFRAILLDCNSGKVLWQNQALLRDIPTGDDPRVSEIVQQLLLTFPHK